jgi:hypothetical protein
VSHRPLSTHRNLLRCMGCVPPFFTGDAPGGMQNMNLSEVRKRAWATRRQKYGPRGHGGSYSRVRVTANQEGMLNLLIRLHLNAQVSEGQLSKAIGLHRVDVRRIVDEYRERTGEEYAA